MFERSRRMRVVIPFVAALVLAPAASAAEHPNAGALSGRLHELSGHELRDGLRGRTGTRRSRCRRTARAA